MVNKRRLGIDLLLGQAIAIIGIVEYYLLKAILFVYPSVVEILFISIFLGLVVLAYLLLNKLSQGELLTTLSYVFTIRQKNFTKES